MFCMLLLFYNLKPFKIPPKNNRYVAVWKFSRDIFIVKIFPYGYYVLINDGRGYIYDEVNNWETFISATRLDTQTRYKVLNYIYLLERTSRKIPSIYTYPKHISSLNVIEILNHFSL